MINKSFKFLLNSKFTVQLIKRASLLELDWATANQLITMGIIVRWIIIKTVPGCVSGLEAREGEGFVMRENKEILSCWDRTPGSTISGSCCCCHFDWHSIRSTESFAITHGRLGWMIMAVVGGCPPQPCSNPSIIQSCKVYLDNYIKFTIIQKIWNFSFLLNGSSF